MANSEQNKFKVHILDVKNALQNYIFVLEEIATKQAVIIDPTEADLALNYCREHQLNIQQIWITHHHHDHIAGVEQILAQCNVPVYAPQAEVDKIPFATHYLQDKQQFLFQQWNVEVISTPGHTAGHICYFIDALDIIFCGDTLFVMGCARINECTHQQMYHSLNRLAALPPRTVVYCAHEYTLSNAKFALSVEEDNISIQQRAKEVELLRNNQQPTVPTTIAQELETNPFLRVLSLQQFTELRLMKDNF